MDVAVDDRVVAELKTSVGVDIAFEFAVKIQFA
jgi:hypothetical protein